MVNALLEFEPDLSLQDTRGNTPLSTLILWKLVQVSVIKMLLRQGSDVNKPNKQEETPLFLAIRTSNKEIVRLLLHRGANANHVSKFFGTALHVACRYGSFEIFELIIDEAGVIEQQHPVVGSIISAVCMRSEPNDDVTLEILKHLRGSRHHNKIALNERHGLYGCPLNVACLWRRKSTVEWLLREQAKVHIEDNAGRYPIHFAAYRDISISNLIRSNGADLTVRDKMGRTILHVAVQSGSYRQVKHVLDCNPSFLDAIDNDGWTPLHYAVRGMYFLKVRKKTCRQTDCEAIA